MTDKTTLLEIEYPSEFTDPYWTDIKAMYEIFDQWIQANQEDKLLVISGGGTLDLTGSTFTWPSNITIHSLKSGAVLTILASNLTVADGEIVYVTATRPLSTGTLALSAGNPTNKELNIIPIGVRIGGNMHMYFSGFGKHSIDSATFHEGVSGATTDNFVSFKAGGLPQDSGYKASDFAVAAVDMQNVYDNDAAITFDKHMTWDLNEAYAFTLQEGSQSVAFTGTAANQMTAVMNVQSVDVDTAAAITIDANAASYFNVTSANLTLKTTTSGIVNLLGATGTHVGTGSPGHLGTPVSGDLYVKNRLEVDAAAFFDSTVDITGLLSTAGIRLSTNSYVYSSSIIGGIYPHLDTQTVDCMVLAPGTTPNYILMIELGDIAFDFAHAQQTDPTLFIHSRNQTTDEWIGFNHDGTNGVIAVGTGTLSIPSAMTVTGLLSANGNIFLSANGSIYNDAAVGVWQLNNTSQTVPTSTLLVGTGPNHIIMCEYADRNFNFAHTQQTNPTFFIHSANQATDEWISFTHDQTDAVIKSGKGNIKLDDAVTITGVAYTQSIIMPANAYIGVSAALRGSYIPDHTSQTVRAHMLATGTTGNYLLMCEYADTTFDFAHTQQTNPTLYIHSANQATDEWVGFAHNQTNASYTRGTGVHEFDAPIRGATSLWKNYRQLGSNSIGVGASGATYIPPDAAGANASIGGWHLDNAPTDEYLYFEFDVHNDWDEASDITVNIFFEQESAGGGAGDTTVLDLGIVYKQPNESTSKGQNLTASSITGAGAVKEQWKQTFTIDYNPGGGMDVETNDLFTGTIWWDDGTSTDATHPIVNHIEIEYLTKQPAIEA